MDKPFPNGWFMALFYPHESNFSCHPRTFPSHPGSPGTADRARPASVWRVAGVPSTSPHRAGRADLLAGRLWREKSTINGGSKLEKPYIQWENRWFPVGFPLNQSIDGRKKWNILLSMEVARKFIELNKWRSQLLNLYFCWGRPSLPILMLPS